METQSTKSSWLGLVGACAALVGFIWMAIYGHPALGFSGFLIEDQSGNATADTQVAQSNTSGQSLISSSEPTQATVVVEEPTASETTEIMQAEAAAARAEAQAETTEAAVVDAQATEAEIAQAQVAETAVAQAAANPTEATQVESTQDEIAQAETAAARAEAQAVAAQRAVDQKRAENDALLAAGDAARRMADENKIAKRVEAEKAVQNQLQELKNNEQTALIEAGDKARKLAEEMAATQARLNQQTESVATNENTGVQAADDSSLEVASEPENEEQSVAAAEQAQEQTEQLQPELAQSDKTELPAEAAETVALLETGEPTAGVQDEQPVEQTAAVSEELQIFESMRADDLSKLQEYSQNLTFNTGEWVMSETTQGALDNIFETLFLYEDVAVRLDVYSSDSDDEVVNRFVTQQRARAIKRYLVDRGLEAGRISSIGAGRKDDQDFTGVALAIREN